MKQFWHKLTTYKSFDALRSLKKDFDFILIGGWAVFLYTHSLKSKDIDLVIDFDALAKFKKKFNVTKNERLKKYEAKKDEIDIDLYVPFYSNPGLPAEKIKNYITLREGFLVPKLEVLLILKQGAFSQRRGSPKGEKDKIDIFSLLLLPGFDFNFYKKVLEKNRKEGELDNLKELLGETTEVLELDLNRKKLADFKKGILKKLNK